MYVCVRGKSRKSEKSGKNRVTIPCQKMRLQSRLQSQCQSQEREVRWSCQSHLPCLFFSVYWWAGKFSAYVDGPASLCVCVRMWGVKPKGAPEDSPYANNLTKGWSTLHVYSCGPHNNTCPHSSPVVLTCLCELCVYVCACVDAWNCQEKGYP